MLRMITFNCTTHGAFEELVTLPDGGSITSAQMSCSVCGEMATAVLEAPRVVNPQFVRARHDTARTPHRWI